MDWSTHKSFVVCLDGDNCAYVATLFAAIVAAVGSDSICLRIKMWPISCALTIVVLC